MLLISSKGYAQCDVPSGLLETNIFQNSADLDWGDATGALEYQVDYRAVGAGTFISQVVSSSNASASNLFSGTTYEWRVRSNCSEEVSDFSALREFTTSGPDGCTVPTGLSVIGTTDVTATLDWDDATGAVAYALEYRPLGASQFEMMTSSSSGETLTGLSLGTTYQWRVASRCTMDGSVSSELSGLSTFTTTGAPACDTPGSLSGAGTGDNTADLDWGDIAAAQDYRVEFRVAGTGAFSAINTGNNTSEISLSGLFPGTTYQWRVKSVCSADGSLQSGFSGLSTFSTTGVAACEIPSGLSSGSITSNSVSLDWNDANGVDMGDSYIVEYRISGAFTAQSTSTSNLNLMGLQPSTKYQWRVRSVCEPDGSLTSSFSSIASFTTDAAIPCDVPSSLTETMIDDTSADVDWGDANGALDYVLEYRAVGAGSFVSSIEGSSDGMISGLLSGTTYEWRVKSRCTMDGSIQSAFTSLRQFTTTGVDGCADPTGLTVDGTGDMTADLNWDDASGAVEYRVEYRPQGTSVFSSEIVTLSEANLTGLSLGTTYQWRVKTRCAADGSVSSSFSSLSTFTTTGASACSIPDGLSVTGTSDLTANLDWNDGSGTIEYIVEYRVQGTGPFTSATTPNSMSQITIGGLFSGTTYQWRVKNICSADGSLVSNFSSLSTFTTTGTDACEVPTNLMTTSTSESTADLDWDDANGVDMGDSYIIEYRVSGTFTSITSSTSDIQLTGLLASTTYQWRVKSMCETDGSLTSAFSSLESFTTDAPATRFLVGREEKDEVESIEELSRLSNIKETKIFGSRGSVKIDFGTEEDARAQIAIYGLDGRLNFQTDNRSAGLMQFEIPISHSQSGLQIVRLIYADRSIQRKVLVGH